jgi:arylsulfatase A-like enzyme/HEAT repeat protein
MKSSTFGSNSRGVGAALAGGCMTAILLAALELGAVGVVCFRNFAGIWELQWGSVWLVPTAIAICSALGLGGALVVSGLSGTSRWQSMVTTIVLGALVALWVFSVTEGRHFQPWWRRVGVIALVSGFTCFAVHSYRRKVFAWARRQRGSALAAGVGLIVLLELGNRFVLVRLYPNLHLGLAVAVGLLAGALGALLLAGRLRGGLAFPLGCAAVCSAAWATVPLTAPRLLRFDNYLFVLGEQAPLLREALRLPASLAHTDPIDVTIDDDSRDEGQSGLNLQGKSVLLVTVDALRADHVGAYGYGRPTTPFLDRLAKRGVRFEYAYCPTPHTSYSLTSLMTGKYIRPLLLQGTGNDSETWADHLRRYGYKTAAFFPPAVFFIDPSRFQAFDQKDLGFEYVKREFLEGPERVAQVLDYLDKQDAHAPVFAWVHVFAPHEPYQRHAEFDFGERDVDRYDSEVAFADATVRGLIEGFEKRRPGALLIVTADHGEEFGDHGGRYHGTTVYEEQVRVPLIVVAEGALEPAIVSQPVQTIDLLPTVLSGLSIPVRPRIRGRDLGGLLSGGSAEPLGFAYAETDRQSMLARGSLRLLCERRLGACQLFDLDRDPGQQRDVAQLLAPRFDALRAEVQRFNASHGRYELAGLRAEGRGWPAPLLRAIAGDEDALGEVSELLDDADVEVRRKAAEVLFRAKRQDTAPALQLAVQREEDPEVRNYAGLALQRLGQGAGLTVELLRSDDLVWRRRAALALAEQGDPRGVDVLIDWWMHPDDRDHETSLDLLGALGRVKAKEAVGPLTRSLPDVRLRPGIAQALARIGVEDARGPLARALANEPYQGTRTILAEALVELGADTELVMPLRRWLGVPDPMLGGLTLAARAEILEQLGGPSRRDLSRLREHANLGELITVVVPKGGNGGGVRVLVEAVNRGTAPAKVLVGKPRTGVELNLKGTQVTRRRLPEIHPMDRIELEFPPGGERVLRWLDATAEMGLSPGRSSHVVVFAQTGLEVSALAVLPHQDEIAAAGAKAGTDDSADENP